ncbi:MAG TPA: hypothetical protein VI197_14055 [Polyangiaceae bacterium]
MKAYAIAFLGSLGLSLMGCNIEVDDCGDDDWDDDDDQPCETHVHSDTSSTTTSGPTTTSGSSASSGGSGGSGSKGSGATGGGPSNAGGSSGSGGGNDSGSDSGSGSGDSSGGSGGSGATASSGNDSGGASAGSDAATTGAAGACADCNPLPDGESCLWGVQKMDSCCGVDVLVDVAAQECADYGLELSDFVLQDSCSGGHRQVDFQCCKSGMSGCTTEEVALEACVGEGIVTDLAEQVCADMGQDLTSFEPIQACGADTYQGVEVTCCVMDPE